MEIKIRYEDIIERCEKLSSFEAEGKVDANGKSRYLEIHINEVDKLLITDYIKQAQAVVEERMDRMIEGVSELTETQTVIIPSYAFEGFIEGDGGILGMYEEITSVQSTKPNGTLMYHTGINKFAIVAEKRNPTEWVKYDAYTDVSAVGIDYIYEKGINKAYNTFPNDGKAYTWDTDGKSLVEFSGSLEIEVEIPNTGFEWAIRTDTRWNGVKTFIKHITEAIVAYTMAAWLRGRLDERVAFYESLYTNTLSLAVKNIFTKQAPK